MLQAYDNIIIATKNTMYRVGNATVPSSKLRVIVASSTRYLASVMRTRVIIRSGQLHEIVVLPA